MDAGGWGEMSPRAKFRLVPQSLVAIVGAPNVGKSTLYNRLVGRRRAIVTDEPGVTRDRLYGEVSDVPRPFRVVDTGGLTPNTASTLVEEIAAQAASAMDEAAVLLFIVDVRAGLTALDRDVAALLRRRGLPIVLVANKVDSPKQAADVLELHELGLGAPVSVSAEHGPGIDDLLQRIDALLANAGIEPGEAVDEEEPPLSLAIVGRPNVGKSSLLNRLVGEERVVVSDVPGTTRDAIDTLLTVGARRYRLIDTAGIRRAGRVNRGTERFSVARARASIERCDVAVLVLDASEPFAAQDAHVAGFVQEAQRPLVVAVNKWDLIEEREQQAKAWEQTVRERLRFLKEAPLVLLSAKTGQRVTRLLDLADELWRAGGRHIPTPELNRWLQSAAGVQYRAPQAGGSTRVYYATQTGIHPPTFLVFCNDPRRVHFSFRRYLENSLREQFDFGGSPLRLRFRARRPNTERS